MNIPIITIGRQYGSGGREIAKLLASRLDIPLYDKEILTEAAKSSGFSEQTFEMFDESKESMLYYALTTGSMYGMELPLPVQLCLEQFRAIGEVAQKGPCIIVGRCANYVLRDQPNVLSIFIHAPKVKRIDRICRLQNMTDAEAEKQIRITDKRRAAYYQHYTDWKWGDAEGYDLSINSAKTGIGGAVNLIEQYIVLTQEASGK